MLKFYYAPGTCALASHIALEEAGAAYGLEKVDFASNQQRSPEYLKINPKGRAPALATDRGVLTENPAILAYVAQSFPEAGLAPTDPFDFADMQAFNVFIASSVHIAFAHVFRPARYGDETAVEGMKAKSLESIADYFGMIDEKLGDREWVHAWGFSTSDPYLYTMVRWTPRIALDLSRFPHVAAHQARMEQRPAVRRALELEGQPLG